MYIITKNAHKFLPPQPQRTRFRTMSYIKELQIARLAVKKASLLTKTFQAEILANRAKTTITKEDKSPVTIGDYSAQAVIINAIRNNFPADKVVGEESSDDISADMGKLILDKIHANDATFHAQFTHEFDTRIADDAELRHVIDLGNYEGGAHGRFWCLDPIDGTKGFLRGEQFAVCLALIVDGKVQVGVIGCPNLKIGEETGFLYSAVAGEGAFVEPLFAEGDAVKIHSREVASTSELVSLEGVEAGHSSHDDQGKIKAILGVSKTNNMDSQVKYCCLAHGLGDIYLRLPFSMAYQEKIWDHAAGSVIVTEAGGRISDAFGTPLDFSQGRTLKTKGVIAGVSKHHDAVVSASRQVLTEKFSI